MGGPGCGAPFLRIGHLGTAHGRPVARTVGRSLAQPGHRPRADRRPTHRTAPVNGTFERCASVPEAFAELVARELADDMTTLFLSGGTLAADCYRALAARHTRGVGPEPDWSAIDVYYGDERCVPLDN